MFKEGQLADFPEKHVELTVNDEGQIYLAGLLKDLGLSASAGRLVAISTAVASRSTARPWLPRATTSIPAPSSWATPFLWVSARASS